MYICKFQYGFGKKKEKFFYGHACGVRVQRVQKVQKVQRVQRERFLRWTGLRPEGS